MWTRINWNQLYNVHPRLRVPSINWQLIVTEDIREKKRKQPVFFLYGSSVDIVRWDMALKKKKSSLITKPVMHVLSWFNAVRHHHFLPNFLASPKPGKVARHISTWMNSESYIFLCFFSYFWRQFMWYFEKAEKIASMSEMLKKSWYNKHNKPLIYRQQLTVR